jgi:hypothetical protein
MLREIVGLQGIRRISRKHRVSMGDGNAEETQWIQLNSLAMRSISKAIEHVSAKGNEELIREG